MNRRFLGYAWFVLAYNVAVILWGAFVRATGSGAGCGDHWPLCNGEVMPRSPQLATVIEFTHRLTSSLAGVFVIILVIAAFRCFPKGHRVRQCSVWALALTITEGLIGAWLVLAGHVASNTSVWRGVSLSIHLVNTLFLLAALTCTAWFSRWQRSPRHMNSALLPFVGMGGGLLFIAITGGIAALGDTLFASESFGQGFAQDFSESSHIFLRLRVLHPIAAVTVGVCIIVLGVRMRVYADRPLLARLALGLASVTALQIVVGALNLVLLAPVWMQILHLLVGDLVWISFVLLTVEALYSPSSALDRNGIGF